MDCAFTKASILQDDVSCFSTGCLTFNRHFMSKVVVILRGAGWAMAPPDFWLAPFFGATSFFLNFPYKFVWLTYKLQ